jgi:RNA polymerase sigma factor (sigma-70 family)
MDVHRWVDAGGVVATPLVSEAAGEVADDAVELLYLRYAPVLRRIAMAKYAIPAADVDELVNDVFATYLTNPGVVRDLRAYVIGGIHNASRDYWRRRHREVAIESVAEPRVEETVLEDLSQRMVLAATLARLRAKCRLVLFRYYCEGETKEVIAAEINTSPANVLYLLHKCRQRARRVYEAMQGR